MTGYCELPVISSFPLHNDNKSNQLPYEKERGRVQDSEREIAWKLI